MVVEGNGMETKVFILPYVRSTIDKNAYIQGFGNPIIVTSVPNYEEKLIRIELPDCTTVVLNADRLITAIKKCVLM